MPIEKITHYSISNNPPSVYDNESLTALELTARVTKKLNDNIEEYNNLENNTINKLSQQDAVINNKHTTLTNSVNAEIDNQNQRITNSVNAQNTSINTSITAQNLKITNVENRELSFENTMDNKYNGFLSNYQKQFGVVNSTGESITDVMSQKAVSGELRSVKNYVDKLDSAIYAKPTSVNLFNNTGDEVKHLGASETAFQTSDYYTGIVLSVNHNESPTLYISMLPTQLSRCFLCETLPMSGSVFTDKLILNGSGEYEVEINPNTKYIYLLIHNGETEIHTVTDVLKSIKISKDIWSDGVTYIQAITESTIKPFDENKTYKDGDYVIQKGKIYVCRVGKSNGIWDDAYWCESQSYDTLSKCVSSVYEIKPSINLYTNDGTQVKNYGTASGAIVNTPTYTGVIFPVDYNVNKTIHISKLPTSKCRVHLLSVKPNVGSPYSSRVIGDNLDKFNVSISKNDKWIYLLLYDDALSEAHSLKNVLNSLKICHGEEWNESGVTKYEGIDQNIVASFNELNETVTTLESTVTIKVNAVNNRIENLESIAFEGGSNEYVTIFPDKEMEVIHKTLFNKDANTISFGVITDTHNTSLANRRTAKQAKAINSLCEKIGVNFVIHLGDAIQGSLTTKAENQYYLAEYWASQHKTFLPVMYTVAHHEQYGPLGTSGWLNDPEAITKSEALGMWGKKDTGLAPVYSSDNANWYFDIGETRFVGIDSASMSNNAASFSQYVIDFLTTAIATTKNVIVFSHVPSRATVSYYNDGISNAPVVENLLKNAPNVKAFFHGHTHWDNIVTSPGNNFPYISTLNGYAVKIDPKTYCSEGNPTAYDRVVGEYSEYGFDIVNYHTDTGIINMFRFGAGTDRVYNP